MKFTAIRIKWAKKLLGAKYFVVLTDKESAIALDGAKPDSFTDILALSAQAAEVNKFYEMLGELVKQHEAAVEELIGKRDGKKTTIKVKKPSEKAKTIKVAKKK